MQTHEGPHAEPLQLKEGVAIVVTRLRHTDCHSAGCLAYACAGQVSGTRSPDSQKTVHQAWRYLEYLGISLKLQCGGCTSPCRVCTAVQQAFVGFCTADQRPPAGFAPKYSDPCRVCTAFQQPPVGFAPKYSDPLKGLHCSLTEPPRG